MNWEALGSIAELVGSVAVLATLIYLAVQIKKTQEIAQAQSYDASRLVELEQSKVLIAHADLIERSNAGEELTGVETRVLNTMLYAMARNSMTEYFSSLRIRKANLEFIPSQFGYFIANNPGVYKWWKQYLERIKSGKRSAAADEWLQAVNKTVNELANGT